jgi:aspartyl protease family protein
MLVVTETGRCIMRRLLFFSFLMISFSVMAVERIQVLGLFTGKALLLVDDRRYTLAVGESSPEGVKLIAADSDRAIIAINGERREVRLGSQISSHYPEAQKKVVDIYPDSNGMYRVEGSINNHSVSFLVDTGASAVAMNSGQAKRLGIDYRRKGIAGMAETASAQVPVYQVKLDKVTVGSIRLYGVVAMVIEGAQPSQVLLGQSFLNQLQMKREGALLRLEQSH